MKTQRQLRVNLALADTGVPSLGGLKHFPFAHGVFIFPYIYTLLGRFPYAQNILNEASKNKMLSANT